MTATSLSKEELLALDGKGLEAILIQISAQLLTRGWMLATAESCTGGMIAAACTDLAGSSQWFERGFVTYSNAPNQKPGYWLDIALGYRYITPPMRQG